MPDYSDLDRAWQVNGRELAEAACRVTRRQGAAAARAEDWTRDVLREAGAVEAHPDEGHVTVAALAEVLEQWTIREPGGTLPLSPVWVARAILDMLDGEDPDPDDPGVVEAHVCCEHAGPVTVNELADALRDRRIVVKHHNENSRCATVTDPEAVAQTLLRVISSRRDETGDAAVLNESIRTGTPLRADEDEEPGPLALPADLAADERVCGDPELVVLSSMWRWLEPLTPDGRERVLAYLADRYDIETAPY